MTRFSLNSMRKPRTSPRKSPKSTQKSKKSLRHHFPKTLVPARFKALVPPGINVRPESVVVPVNPRKSILGQPAKVAKWHGNTKKNNGPVKNITVPTGYKRLNINTPNKINVPSGYAYTNLEKLQEVAVSPKP